jgi:GT2 family glycosyltransferase
MSTCTATVPRVRVAGKFFRLGNQKWFLKGFSYGPFAPNSEGEQLPDRDQLLKDLRHISLLGANSIRLYFPPPRWVVDEACALGLRVFIDVPWEKHRCFFEDWDARERARRAIEKTARELGSHPGVFAISVANEFPNDVVRFYGAAPVQQFVDELIDVVKQEAPECLATFVNFPTTEFLSSSRCDFHCFNVYIHDPVQLGAYFDRLHHIAGERPLVLGEHGIDSQRHGEDMQRELLTGQQWQVGHRGLAGSVVFSYTDDWYTGGQQIEDWKFGVTTRNRDEKISAAAVRDVWEHTFRPEPNGWPKVSVVVCSYNGGATLRECLLSLMNLSYPDYEVILVDDGSTDGTPQIAEEFPQIIYIRQSNHGLSHARNVGARRATGEVVAYTDSDCVADEDWLSYLVRAMADQNVVAIGGPNITPPSDGWIAKCVAVCPGNPSHVMLDDRRAEHVPGCNMAFRRDVLLEMDGFDPQFRQAGDDVDICWRLLDDGFNIGFAPAAMVWHHRRATVSAYLKQQRGYGKSEALVRLKHPQRCGVWGRFTWNGIIYGDGAVGVPLLPPRIYHGQFGSALFQTIYRQSHVSYWACMMSLEWHAIALFLLALSSLFPAVAIVSLLMWCGTAALAIRSAQRAPLPSSAPWWCRPLTGLLYVLQPLVRSWHRYTSLLRSKRLPELASGHDRKFPAKQISVHEHDLYWQSDNGLGREHLLKALLAETKRLGWSGDFNNSWVSWDMWLVGDRWHDITIHTVTEEVGWPKRFTRARCKATSTFCQRAIAYSVLIWCSVAIIALQPWAMVLGEVAAVWTLCRIKISRRRCLRAAIQLVARSAAEASLSVFAWNETATSIELDERSLEPTDESCVVKS